MSISIKSEIAPLKKVLLHRPGKELEHLSPDALERLLFDDIPYLHAAQAEHDRFAAVLQENKVEVVYLEDLAALALATDSSVKSNFVKEVVACAGSAAQTFRDALQEYLLSIADPKELVLKTMAGVCRHELQNPPSSRLADLTLPETRFAMDPMPNLYFTRDPFACIGTGVSLNHMYSITRSRETIFGKYILNHHPDFAGSVPLYYDPHEPFSIEGGDILNLNEHVLAVGISQRTQPEAIERLAHRLFSDPQCSVDTILAFDIPRTRAFMHLDTVFTQIDVDKFTVHPGILNTLRTFELTRRGQADVCVRELETPLAQTLAHYLEVERVQLIRCGGHNHIASEREQWNDGSNTLCLSPGVVTVYDRNYVTNEILQANGVTVLKIPSAELSRGRGGPRCMSMPLQRA